MQATTGVRGVATHHEKVVNFAARQWLDMLAPANFMASNPEIQKVSAAQSNTNLMSGLDQWWHDIRELISSKISDHSEKKPAYQPGRDVAISEGSIVFRNHLIELIQYTPKTAEVSEKPLLIVPSWIMKYYILDLSPENSMVSYLTEQGFTVFMISWRNPDKYDRDIGMDNYVQDGLYAALQEVNRLCNGVPVHTAGYCLGGTLLAIGMAGLARRPVAERPAVETMTLLAAQTDFTEPGELGLFIDESQLAMLDALMWRQGYLDGQQMTGSFQFLNSRDLIWSRNMKRYLLGESEKLSDLMSWNADTTRMPYRMHSEYLKHLFLHNDLAQGRYQLAGKAISLKDIDLPLFITATEADHVSPWRSVYKIRHLTDTVVEFILASGGHNAGIVAAPTNPKCSYRHSGNTADSHAEMSPQEWLGMSQQTTGSWWCHWTHWLRQHDSNRIPAREIKNPIVPAPGTYVFQY